MAGQRENARRYQQIAEDLRAQIVSGELPPGADVPGENSLMATYDVARSTARQALAMLRDEGLTEARQGARIKVRSFRPIRRNATERLSASVWGQGRAIWDVDVPDRPRVIEVTVDEVAGPDHVLRVFDAAEGTRFCRRTRRFAIDNKPIMLAVSYLRADLVANSPITQEDTGPGGTYARLADLGHAPVRFREEIRVRMPSPVEVEKLSLGAGTPVILVARTAADADGTVVEINEMTLDAGSYLLEYDFTA